MTRTRQVGEFPVDEQATAAGPQPEAPEVIANKDTMTTFGVTVGKIVATAQEEVNRMTAEGETKDATILEQATKLTAKDTKIAELVEYGKNKNAILQELVTADKAKAVQIAELGPRVESLTKDLGMARLAAQAKGSGIPQNLERLPSGGIRLAITLDEDAAVPFLSQAECAGEDPAAYIARQLEEALLAFAAS